MFEKLSVEDVQRMVIMKKRNGQVVLQEGDEIFA